MEIKLWDHQKEGVKRFMHEKEAALLWEIGVGKTLTTIQLLRYKYTFAKKILSTIILCPVIVIKNWKDEFKKFSKIPERNILALCGPIENRIAEFEKAKELFGDQFIIITNYDAIVVNKKFFDLIHDWRPVALVADESQRLKSHNSKRTKLVTKLSDRAYYKYILSGTPILNTPMDIYSQYRVLDGGKTFGTNFYIFRAKYFLDKNAGMPKAKYFPNYIIRKGSIEEMNKLIYNKASRAIKSECLDLPPLIKQKLFVELSDSQKKLYLNMKKDFIAYLENTKHVTVATLAMTKALRLQQIVTGFIKSDEQIEVSLGKTPRQEALKELLEDITPGHKVLVWCVFKQNYEQVRKICEELEIDYVEAHGEISNKEKYENVDKFNKMDNYRVFIGHPGSLGLGITLCAASYSIYYSRGFSLEFDLQSEGRNYRGGSEVHEKITRIDLIAKDTIDELIDEALEKKIIISEDMLRTWKERI